jgi:hypothetical protein
MGGNSVLPAWDTFVLAIPFLGMLALAMFRLDERFAAPKARTGTRRHFCEVQGDGRSFLSDPDGKPWQKGSTCQVHGPLSAPLCASAHQDPCGRPHNQRWSPKTRFYVIER